MAIAVTGGNGYIGSHVVRLLEARGEEVLVIDAEQSHNLSRTSNQAHLDLSEPNATAMLSELFLSHEVSAVIHLAARKQVGESVQKPLWYFQQNIFGQSNLMQAMEVTRVNKFVFSSSAAVYGIPDTELALESTNPQPINPYGETKLVGEWMSTNQSRATDLRHVSLRYFNVAGAGWKDLGDPYALNLIPIVFEKLEQGLRPPVFGDDYDTPDGSCIRDYVHVLDLAQAHLDALDYLEKENREFNVFNVGTGAGSSVFEVLKMIRTVTELDFEHEVVSKREGDPPTLTASIERISKVLGWKAKHNLEEIIDSAWQAKLYQRIS